MNRAAVSFQKKQKGQSMVELSLIMTFLLLLMAGAADFGRMYFLQLALRDAAQEGAAYGSTDPSNYPEIDQRVRAALGDTMDPSTIAVNPSVTVPPYHCAGIVPATLEANAIEVAVSYDMPIAVPFLGAIVGSDHITLTASVQNTILTPPC